MSGDVTAAVGPVYMAGPLLSACDEADPKA